MKVIVQVPIKAVSERIPGKNFKDYNGKPLFRHLLDRLTTELPVNYKLVVDIDSWDTEQLIKQHYPDIDIFRREKWFGSNQANGNHLLTNFAAHNPGFDIYVQTFVTAPDLQVNTITEMVWALNKSDKHNSATLFTKECGWFWFEDMALNYNPDTPAGLPRSQDATVLKETTGVYAVKRDALLFTGCRLAAPTLKVIVDSTQAKDIDNPGDLK